MNRIFSSFVCLFLIVGILFTFCIFPEVSATDTVSSSFDILDYSTVDFEYTIGSAFLGFGFDLPFKISQCSFNFLFFCNVPIVSSYFGVPGKPNQSLSVSSLGNDLYAISGPVTLWDYGFNDCLIYFNLGGSPARLISPISLLCYTGITYSVPFNSIYYYNYGDHTYPAAGPTIINGDGTLSAASFLAADVNYTDPTALDFDITTWISSSEWRKYDQLCFRFSFHSNSIKSISSHINGVVVPVEVSYLDNSGFYPSLDESSDYDAAIQSPTFGNTFVSVTLDLSNVDRASSSFLGLSITGVYPDSIYAYRTYFGQLISIVGLVFPDPIEADIVWYKRIYQQLIQLINGDGSGSDALQTQEQVNTAVNNEIVAAVNDWNTQIDVVQTGYDNAINKVTPGLHWLANLADGVFSGIGWFGNVYFLVGLVSVFMLILSKSGLAHKISNVYSRRGN